MRARRGLTLLEVLVGLLVVGLAMLCVYWATPRPRLIARGMHMRCRNHLNQLAKGMAAYLNEFGDNMYYPFPLGLGSKPNDFTGAEWLASLYWTGIMPDPRVFICPSSDDVYARRFTFGEKRAGPEFGSRSVSYAGMHYYSVTDTAGEPLPIKDDYPPNEAMASDDTEGTINHGEVNNGGMAVLFFDSHVEFKVDHKTRREIDLERAVGRKGGLLEKLRN